VDVLQNKAPNGIDPIESKAAMSTTSKMYKMSSSEHLIQTICNNGFTHTDTTYVHPRKEKKLGFQKHLMVFEHASKGYIDENNKVRMLVTNSHDGSSCVVFNIGVYRMICANGLVVGDSLFEIKVKHLGDDFIHDVRIACKNMIELFSTVADRVRKMQNTILDDNQINQLCEKIAMRRLSHVNDLIDFDMEMLKAPTRNEDKGNTLYVAFNRAQEIALNGGLTYKFKKSVEDSVDGTTHTIIKKTTRKIKSIDKTIELNKFIWSEAEKLAA